MPDVVFASGKRLLHAAHRDVTSAASSTSGGEKGSGGDLEARRWQDEISMGFDRYHVVNSSCLDVVDVMTCST